MTTMTMTTMTRRTRRNWRRNWRKSWRPQRKRTLRSRRRGARRKGATWTTAASRSARFVVHCPLKRKNGESIIFTGRLMPPQSHKLVPAARNSSASVWNVSRQLVDHSVLDSRVELDVPVVFPPLVFCVVHCRDLLALLLPPQQAKQPVPRHHAVRDDALPAVLWPVALPVVLREPPAPQNLGRPSLVVRWEEEGVPVRGGDAGRSTRGGEGQRPHRVRRLVSEGLRVVVKVLVLLLVTLVQHSRPAGVHHVPLDGVGAPHGLGLGVEARAVQRNLSPRDLGAEIFQQALRVTVVLNIRDAEPKVLVHVLDVVLH
mmetsp:Transcript_1931/g.7083  ORF Transcript_1931/g.7083 Transcript_1931/m.7083 type:complete len:315 (+) Transcript_1931:1488-2432(+)